MNARVERAQALLDALDSGAPAKRPTPSPRGATQVLCKRGCGVQIIVAPLPTGQWVPLDRHPTGELCIVQGFARTWGQHLEPGLDRFSFHRCQGGERG